MSVYINNIEQLSGPGLVIYVFTAWSLWRKSGYIFCSFTIHGPLNSLWSSWPSAGPHTLRGTLASTGVAMGTWRTCPQLENDEHVLYHLLSLNQEAAPSICFQLALGSNAAGLAARRAPRGGGCPYLRRWIRPTKWIFRRQLRLIPDLFKVLRVRVRVFMVRVVRVCELNYEYSAHKYEYEYYRSEFEYT